VPADADTARLGERLHAGRDIDAVAEDVVAIDDYVTEIDPDPEPDPALLGHLRLAVNHPALDLDRTAHGINNARKLRQEAVACVLDYPTPVLRDLRIDQLLEVPLQPIVRPLLVRAHQPRVSRDVSGQDRGEAAGLAHSASPAAKRKPDSNSSRCSAFRR